MPRTRGAHVGASSRAMSFAVAAIVALSGLALLSGPVLSAGPTTAASSSPGSSASAGASGGPGTPGFKPPVLAYYYVWFNTASWSHAKADQPLLGPYTSTDPGVISQQVAWARESGVDAFIVSWKSSPSLNLALQELVAEAHRQNLKLVLIYEGLDVNRNPIPVATVESDMVWFENTYGSDPAFDLYGKPAVIWSGSWRFSDSDISTVRNLIDAPNKILLLGSEKSAAAYQARAGLFDGDAYYWSSADPMSTPGYLTRLNALGQAVHAGGGLWLAPAPVGFDARLNGGTSTVDRRNGTTLTAAWSDALGTSPDGIAVISWNEYTEGSYIEPSVNYGFRYLTVLSSLTGAPGPSSTAIPSEPAPPAQPSAAATAAVAGATGATGAGAAGGGGGPARPAPMDYSPASILFAAGVLLILLILGLRLRSGREELVEPKEGR
jgi:hypothetical protein